MTTLEEQATTTELELPAGLVRIGPVEPAPEAVKKVDFFSLTRKGLGELLQERLGEPVFRATQLFNWVYRKGVTDFDVMTNIKRDLREKLKEIFYFPTAGIQSRQVSSDGSRKYLLEMERGERVEAVMIKQPKRMTLCVSSQVGCGMACAFCRTGTMGFRRHLSSSEILRQVRAVILDAAEFGDMFENIVFMGMGEPLHNIEGITGAIRVLTDKEGFLISGRKITVSTVGLVPGIERFVAANLGVNLAVSLNATTDEVRAQVMPVNKAFPLEKLLGALRGYPLKKRQRITIEYVMLSGVNDLPADLERLPKLLRGIPSKVNLIPYNENAGLGFKTPSRATIERWHMTLLSKGLQTTVRWSKGADISAACGQLATADGRVAPAAQAA